MYSIIYTAKNASSTFVSHLNTPPPVTCTTLLVIILLAFAMQICMAMLHA